METFGLGLQITGMGMGLVFLTLIIVMGCIWVLGRLFSPRTAVGDADGSDDGLETAAASTATIDESDQVAAITAAILMERQKGRTTVPAIEYDDEILGEIVTVVTIDSGQGTWKGYGRLQAVR
jgi:sodium pump decarboxylase gamma subunit